MFMKVIHKDVFLKGNKQLLEQLNDSKPWLSLKGFQWKTLQVTVGSFPKWCQFTIFQYISPIHSMAPGAFPFKDGNDAGR